MIARVELLVGWMGQAGQKTKRGGAGDAAHARRQSKVRRAQQWWYSAAGFLDRRLVDGERLLRDEEGGGRKRLTKDGEVNWWWLALEQARAEGGGEGVPGRNAACSMPQWGLRIG